MPRERDGGQENVKPARSGLKRLAGERVGALRVDGLESD
jgi:hypothetical protein